MTRPTLAAYEQRVRRPAADGRRPLFSIVTVTFNAAATLPATIASLEAQRCRDFEHLVIDGGSRDGTLDVVRARAGTIAFWVSERDAGIFDAMNKGVAAARGRWIYFLNAGDRLLDPEVLGRVQDALAATPPSTRFAYGRVRYVDEHRRLVRLHGRAWTGDPIANLPHHQATFVNREAFERHGVYDLRYRLVADGEFFYRLVTAEPGAACFIPVEVGEYDVGGVSSRLENFFRYELEFHRARRANGVRVAPLRQTARLAGALAIATAARLIGHERTAPLVDAYLRLIGRDRLFTAPSPARPAYAGIPRASPPHSDPS
jgi:glycosyltransferase involved in cell wall biosynthesis